VSLVFACIAPHGDVDLAPELRAAMEELGRRCAAAAPEVAVVVSPHSVHVEGHFAVVTAGRVGEWETDGELAATLLEAPLPILGVSYGGNDPSSAEFPLDWGTGVPLAFIGAPRIVDVHVRVHEPGHHDGIADVADGDIRRGPGRGSVPHFHDAPAQNAQGRRADPVRPDHAAAAQDELPHALTGQRVLLG